MCIYIRYSKINKPTGIKSEVRHVNKNAQNSRFCQFQKESTHIIFSQYSRLSRLPSFGLKREKKRSFNLIIIIAIWGFQRGVDNLKIVDNFENKGRVNFIVF